MKRALAAATLLTLIAAHPASASSDSVESVAAEAGVDPQQLAEASAVTGLEPRTYLEGVGEIARPVPPGWPIGGTLGQRIYCVEGIESAHGLFMYNRTPLWNGEHAQGWLGFLPSTARTWGVVIGNRASEWDGASRMIQAGVGGQFAGVAWRRC